MRVSNLLNWLNVLHFSVCNFITSNDSLQIPPDHIDPRNHYYLQTGFANITSPSNNASIATNNATSTISHAPFSNFTRRAAAATPLPTTSTGALKCAAGSPCIDGSCCSPQSICGFGPDFCGSGCQSGCTAKAPCGKYSEGGSQSCGMHLCCSASGWCGATADYCSTAQPAGCQARFGGCQVKQPFQCDPGLGSALKRTVGYYQGSNVYSPDRICNKIAPGDIRIGSYTHLYWAFAEINPTDFTVRASDPRDKNLYKDFTHLSTISKVQTWIGIGGFDFTTANPHAWSDMVSTAANRQKFINSLVDFMTRYGFQGVDIDWEYPVDDKRGGRLDDMKNLVQLVVDMRAKWGTRFGISATLAPDIWYLQHFDAKGLLRSADFIGFMSYDLHGTWDAQVPRIGNVVLGQTNIHDIERDLTPLWFDLDIADMQRVNFGLALYGRGYTLADASCNYADGSCYFKGGNKPGPCTFSEGILSMTEIRTLIREKNLQPQPLGDGTTMMSQITWDDQWVGYDDEASILAKLNYASAHCFGGTMAWSVDLDSGDGRLASPPVSTDNICGSQNGKICPDGQCCSASGFCGTSIDYCGAGCFSGACITDAVTNNGQCGIGNNRMICGGDFPGCCSLSGWCQSSYDCTSGEQSDYNSLDADPLPQAPPISACTMTFSTTADLGAAGDAGNIPAHCQAIYVVETLSTVLAKSLHDYQNIMNGGYDDKFNIYAQAVADNAGHEVNKFVMEHGNGYFSCIVTEFTTCCDYCQQLGGNHKQCQYCFTGECYKPCSTVSGCPPTKREISPLRFDRRELHERDGGPPTTKDPISRFENHTEPCPPDYSKRGWSDQNTIYWTLLHDREDAFYTDLEAATSIPRKDITFTNVNNRKNQCNPGAQPDDKCWGQGMDFNIPIPSGYKAEEVGNPKKLVEAVLTASNKLSDQLNGARDTLRTYTFFGDPSELVDSLTLPVLTIVQAVESMQKVVDTANEIEEEKEKAIILAFLGAILFFIPVVGEVLGSIEELATVGAIVSLLGAAGNTALDIYNVVEDKDNPLLAIFSLVLEPLSFLDIATLAKASSIRRGMSDTDIAKLGSRISDSMTDIRKVTGVCSRP